MNAINTVIERMRQNGEQPALFWRDEEWTYSALFEAIDHWKAQLRGYDVYTGTVCGVLGDYSLQTAALIFALLEIGAIIVPFTAGNRAELADFMTIAGVQRLFAFDADDTFTMTSYPSAPQNDVICSFRARETSGLVVFSSGSTGKPKGILHDCERVMRKFVDPRAGWRTVLFLMMDHFGGFNTFLSTFAYGGAAVCVPDRNAGFVCRAIAKTGATLLPTTPTFLNLLLASGAWSKFDLSSIRLITYGTEVMPPATLQKVRHTFPNAQIKQTYGLSELGVLRSKSENADSVWVKVGGTGFDVKVVDNTLWVRSEANMVGYLNAPNPFDEEGWMCTGDQVEVRGDYLRILGRESDMINVGGQKVFPVEIETVLLQAENIIEAAVFGAKHPLMGQVVHARVTLAHPEPTDSLVERLRATCLEKLARYKIPVKFIVTDTAQHSMRFKKVRRVDG